MHNILCTPYAVVLRFDAVFMHSVQFCAILSDFYAILRGLNTIVVQHLSNLESNNILDASADRVKPAHN